MELSENREYIHRPNSDGSIHSICLYCYRTVADSHSVETVEANEAQHTCPYKTAGEGNPFKSAENNG